MKDILRAAIAVPALKVADVTYNKNAILDCIKKADEAGATLLLTPELSLTGATCGDLFHSDLLLEKVNALGIGPQGFGGRTTALGVNILAMPTHIAGMPCAVNINCHVTRHKSKEIKL